MAAGGGGAGPAGGGGSTATSEDDAAVERFKMKKMISMLEKARGNGTSMITLIMPPKTQISFSQKLLTDEYGTASNIKSRVNRLSVLSAITSAQQRLKGYSTCPENGLVVFVGDVITDEGKERKLAVDFEPFKPINTSLYMCDSRFHVEPLLELMQDDDIFGFIIMDGNGALYGTVQGNVRKVLYKFSVELPKKHGRGGQSSARFARIRQEKRHNYVRKVAETAVQMFITADALNVKGLVLAGSADFKSVLEKSDLFDPRLLAAVLKKVDVSYGGEPGFNQAIELAADALANVKLVAEKKLISKLFEEIAMDSGKYCFGVKDTTTALEMSSVDDLILWEELELNRYQLKHPVTGNPKVLYLKPGEERDASKFRDEEAGVDYEIVSKDPFVDWIAEHYKEFGTELHFVTDRSSEGAQFVKGFGGIGGVLRFKVDFVSLAVAEEEEEEFI